MDIVMQRMTIANVEADMDRLIKVGIWWAIKPLTTFLELIVRVNILHYFLGGAAVLLSQKREELTVQQESLSHKREVLMADGEGPEAEDRLLQEIGEELEVLNANIDYINDSLSDCQATIVQIEETKVFTHTHTGTRSGQLHISYTQVYVLLQDELDSVDTSVVISSCSLAEARHLLDHFLKASIDKVSLQSS